MEQVQTQEQQAQQPNNQPAAAQTTQQETSNPELDKTINDLEMQVARLQKDNKELKTIINSTSSTNNKSSDEIFKSMHDGAKFFRKADGRLMNNVEVCQQLYDYGVACENEGKENPFTKDLMDFLAISKDTSLTEEERNLRMSLKCKNDLEQFSN